MVMVYDDATAFTSAFVDLHFNKQQQQQQQHLFYAYITRTRSTYWRPRSKVIMLHYTTARLPRLHILHAHMFIDAVLKVVECASPVRCIRVSLEQLGLKVTLGPRNQGEAAKKRQSSSGLMTNGCQVLLEEGEVPTKIISLLPGPLQLQEQSSCC